MEQDDLSNNPLLRDLHKLRTDLKMTRKDFALLLDVSDGTVKKWLTRSFKPNATNAMRILEFIGDSKKIHNAIGIVVLNSNNLSNCEALKTRLIINGYARSNHLRLVVTKTFTADEYKDLNKVADFIDIASIQNDSVTDLVFLSKKQRLSNSIVTELKTYGVRVFHDVGSKFFKIDKSK